MAGRSIVGPMGLGITELFGLSRGPFPQGSTEDDTVSPTHAKFSLTVVLGDSRWVWGGTQLMDLSGCWFPVRYSYLLLGVVGWVIRSLYG